MLSWIPGPQIVPLFGVVMEPFFTQLADAGLWGSSQVTAGCHEPAAPIASCNCYMLSPPSWSVLSNCEPNDRPSSKLPGIIPSSETSNWYSAPQPSISAVEPTLNHKFRNSQKKWLLLFPGCFSIATKQPTHLSSQLWAEAPSIFCASLVFCSRAY